MKRRTTIELSAEHHERLVQLAAEQGVKGFSYLVEEAVARYLAEMASRREVIESARAVLGSLSAEDADELRATAREVRESWR